MSPSKISTSGCSSFGRDRARSARHTHSSSSASSSAALRSVLSSSRRSVLKVPCEGTTRAALQVRMQLCNV
eukprot:6206372-Pleurochrysis_carterae.AAC.2